ncbi:hypothetical protein VVD49_07160 [Uliginosibacterium sp. H3]|uniref:Intradiol ring-cleavage dioxygenases domain-containing protein n=1 Tax=Uliginosibacterium silvisoli TaxID=3114758 RepID=A0ABU6K352_9RHOO|nr:hypothetical protein [Uliginosibacterium sp. H3]
MSSSDSKAREVQGKRQDRREALCHIGGLATIIATGMLQYRSLSALAQGRAQVVADASSMPAIASACAAIPEETAGPFPGDGSNSTANGIANALTLPGIVRSDIRSSLAGATGVARGLPLTLVLELVGGPAGCAPLAGHAIYLWHCDALGRYSMYSPGVSAENYLRGVQVTDGSGKLRFSTIVPGCYDGRMPHMHFEVYRDVASARRAADKLSTSQLGFPLAMLNEVYATNGYRDSAANLARTSFASDPVFSDGHDLQICAVSGNRNEGYVATLRVAIAGGRLA